MALVRWFALALCLASGLVASAAEARSPAAGKRPPPVQPGAKAPAARPQPAARPRPIVIGKQPAAPAKPPGRVAQKIGASGQVKKVPPPKSPPAKPGRPPALLSKSYRRT